MRLPTVNQMDQLERKERVLKRRCACLTQDFGQLLCAGPSQVHESSSKRNQIENRSLLSLADQATARIFDCERLRPGDKFFEVATKRVSNKTMETRRRLVLTCCRAQIKETGDECPTRDGRPASTSGCSLGGPRRRIRSTTMMTSKMTRLAKALAALERPQFGNVLLHFIVIALTFATVLRSESVAGTTSTGQRQQMQQVDARLNPRLQTDNGQWEDAHWNIQSFEQAQDKLDEFSSASAGGELTKRFAAATPLDHLSSSDLPSEFRGGGVEEPRERSRLAKLCQQTSSVLASVLPAPFGGHKRSILCQFFGQVNVNGQQAGKKLLKSGPALTASYPVGSVSLPPGIQFQASNQLQMVAATNGEPDSIAILHQHQQPPVSLLATGMHPIQIVLEHQQRQAAALKSQQLANRMSVINPYPITQQADLRAAAPFMQQQQHHHHYHHQQQQNRVPFKFSAPLATSPAVSPNMAASSWRISNLTSSTHQETASHFSTTPLPSQMNDTTASNSTSEPTRTSERPHKASSLGGTSSSNSNRPSAQNYQKAKIVIISNQQQQVPSLGKRANESPQQLKANTSATSGVDKLEAAESRQDPSNLLGVRTIEVTAQRAPVALNQDTQSSPDKDQQQDKHDLGQVQKREELVIASINNLTRIAFGNQLRDTVKVINKLIDQQAGLFTTHKQAGESPGPSSSSSAALVDPMQMSESISRPQIVAMMPQLPTTTKIATPVKTRTSSSIRKSENRQEKTKMTSQDSLRTGRRKQVAESDKQQQTNEAANKLGARHERISKSTVTMKPSHKSEKSNLESTRTSANTKKVPVSSTTMKLAKGTNHAKKRTNYFSPPSTPTPNASTATSTNKLKLTSASTVELKRLTTIGRALLQNELSSSGPSLSQKSARNINQSTATPNKELDLVPSQSISDLSRDSNGWVPSSGPTRLRTDDYQRQKSSTTLVMRKLQREFSRSNTQRLATSTTSTTTQKLPSTTGATVTQFPWLLPDRSAGLETNELFVSPPIAALSSASSDLKTTLAEGPKKWTNRRMVTPYGVDQFASSISSGLVSTRKETGLNRLELRPDSLTTLKMALTRVKTTPAPTTTKEVPQTTLPRSTRLPFSSGTSTQSRWIPSTSLATTKDASTTEAPKSSSTVAVPNRTPVTTSSSTSPSRTTLDIIANSYPTTASKPVSLSDLNEARASESISRYTTHLSEANELIASTRRHFQQPMPQIANTGDYFSAETIASWPEKYQTMISRAMESAQEQQTKTTASKFETTRRNGESYGDSDSPPTLMASESGLSTRMTTPLARHRMDTTTQTEIMRPASSVFIPTNTTGITILPANHKLTASNELTGESASSTSAMVSATETPFELASTITKRLPPYTLISETSTGDTARPTADSISNSSTISEMVTSTAALADSSQYLGMPKMDEEHYKHRSNSNMSADYLRPPYHDTYDQEQQFQLSDPMLVLDQGQSRPHVSRQLYELLVPPNQNFVGLHNPLSRQRFNWSALKYLAQNILAPGRHLNGTSSPDKTTNEPLDESATTKNSDFTSEGEGELQAGSNNTQQRLIDLMTKAGFAPTKYYEYATNDSMRDQLEQPLQEPMGINQQTNSTAANAGKGLFERASNLLSEMKQMEQKRAAALLAAFRYQVPGPLVKPWDMASDLQADGLHSPSAASYPPISRFFADRLDGSSSLSRQLTTGQLLGAVKTALYKQRLVARDELEARLNRGQRRGSFSIDRASNGNYGEERAGATERRRDDFTAEEATSLAEGASKNTSPDIRLEDLEYILANTNNETILWPNESNGTSSQVSGGVRATLFKLLASLGLSNSSSTTNSSVSQQEDFHAIDLSKDSESRSVLSAASHQQPKYIRLFEHQTPLTSRLAHDKALKLFAPTGTKQQAAELIARLRSSATTNAKQTTVKDPTIEFESGNNENKPGEGLGDSKPADEFKCEGRSSGFYPDASSTCRTFYHCSNTGHLLTFNCPSSTRFDEKSLKCGPWYEVQCDIGRVRTRRH